MRFVVVMESSIDHAPAARGSHALLVPMSRLRSSSLRTARAFQFRCIVVDHASRRIPRRLGDLGLPPAELQRHIAWDILVPWRSRGAWCALERSWPKTIRGWSSTATVIPKCVIHSRWWWNRSRSPATSLERR